MGAHRSSDRWITPGVVCTFLLVAGVLVAMTIAGVTYLAARGIDPDPMLRLAAQAVTAVGSLGTLALQLVNRSTVTKVERHTGVLTARIGEAIDRPAPAYAPYSGPGPWPQDGVPLPYEDDEPTQQAPRVSVPALPPMPAHLIRSPRP